MIFLEKWPMAKGAWVLRVNLKLCRPMLSGMHSMQRIPFLY